jgi:Xaa-Pro aminopeptidase
MLFDVPAVQRALAADRLDGWLLYDFHGSNPIAATLAGLAGSSGKLTTRRWYYLIPASGAPRGLVHAIERHNLDGLPGTKEAYAGRRELEAGLRRLLDGCQRVAMEYSPQGAIPYVSRVDAGTFEAVRSLGVDIVSSGDLVQRFEASWSAEALASHRAASERLYRIKDRAFEALRSTMRERGAWDEYELQQKMMEWFSDEELVTDSPPVVAAMENAGNPHYLPSPEAHRSIRANELVLLDLWGKLPTDGAVFADITWVGFTGSSVPAEFSSAFGAIRDGRDAAIQLVQASARERRDLRGWQVDRAAREVIERAGYGKAFIHRTGHSLGGTVHGNGVHMDDYETHDDRRLLPGTGFTIEPGVYFDRFGVRTEVNIYYGDGEATVTGPAQTEIVTV